MMCLCIVFYVFMYYILCISVLHITYLCVIYYVVMYCILCIYVLCIMYYMLCIYVLYHLYDQIIFTRAAVMYDRKDINKNNKD